MLHECLFNDCMTEYSLVASPFFFFLSSLKMTLTSNWEPLLFMFYLFIYFSISWKFQHPIVTGWNKSLIILFNHSQISVHIRMNSNAFKK